MQTQALASEPSQDFAPFGAMSAFDALLDFERRAAEHVAGAAEQVEAPGLWRAIGFRLGTRNLLSGINEVNEILLMPPMTPVPGVKPWLLGVANVRGNLIAIVDLRGYIEGTRSPVNEKDLIARIQTLLPA